MDKRLQDLKSICSSNLPERFRAFGKVRRGYVIALVGTAIWSSTAVFIGYLTTRFHMPPLVLAFWRDLI